MQTSKKKKIAKGKRDNKVNQMEYRESIKWKE